MPVSAYIQAALFVLLNAVALFAAAGTIKILGFWVYVAIFAAVMVASFAMIITWRPETRASPVIVPAAGAPPHSWYISCAA